MRKSSISSAVFVLTGMSLFVAGCAKLPQAAVDAAIAADQAATEAEASEYAPETYRAAQDARAALDAEMSIQAGKMAITRSYDRTAELASAYQAAAEQARQEAQAGREQAKADATALIDATKVTLASTQDLLAKAPKGKGTSQDLAALSADLQAAGALLTEAESAFAAGRYGEARTKAEASRAGIASVTMAVEQATAAVGVRR